MPSYASNYPVYRGANGKLFLIRNNNGLANYIGNTSAMWYDDQPLDTSSK